MNIIFITLGDIKSMKERSIYTDLMQEFIEHGHSVYIVSPIEKRYHKDTYLIKEENVEILKVKIGNIFHTNMIEKGISTILLENKFKNAIKANWKNITFDIVLYSTPPITFAKVIRYLKKSSEALSYLLLKDIFPQNAVDLKLFHRHGIIYWYFRRKEIKLLKLSDYIGTMSKANTDYILRHNSFMNKDRVEECPNSIQPIQGNSLVDKDDIREEYSIPKERTVFLYGGNLGKPQAVDFIIECLKLNSDCEDRYFIICGKGTDYHKLEHYLNVTKQDNVKIINGLPKTEYDLLVQACDIGLIFLDYHFTIPNFPSRILTYMEYCMPVIACTDRASDIGQVITDGGFGFWCESNNALKFKEIVDKLCSDRALIKTMGSNARLFLEENYTTKTSYDIIMKHFVKENGHVS